MISINANYRSLEVLRKFDKKEAANPHYNRIAAELRYLSALRCPGHSGGVVRPVVL